MQVQSGGPAPNVGHESLLGFIRNVQLTAGLWMGSPAGTVQTVAACNLLMSLPVLLTDRERAVTVVVLSRLSGHVFTDTRTGPHSPRDGVTFLLRHFHETLSLQSVATAIGCSKWHLSRCVKHRTGLTFLELLHAVRVLAAIWALTSLPDSVKEVAHRVGYSSTGDLDRHFRAVTRISPTAFRKLLDWPLPR